MRLGCLRQIAQPEVFQLVQRKKSEAAPAVFIV